MTKLQAYLSFDARVDHGFGLLEPNMPRDKAALWCATFASLSGRLGEAQSPADLDQAVVAGINLRGSHQITLQQFAAEEDAIKVEVARHEADED